MTPTPLEYQAPPTRGRLRFAALGYLLRVVKTLPPAVRERVLDGAGGSVTANLPPFADVVRLLEAAGGTLDGRRWQQRLLDQRPDLRSVRERDLSDDTAGRLRARLYLPPVDAPAPTAAFVWVHGGAFVLGSLDAEEAHWPAIELAATGIPVLSVDYRTCLNGVAYPEPQDDVLTAWQWAVDHAHELGVDPEQLHLGGGSAGGCLVAGATLRLRDRGRPLPASLYLAYPVLQADLPPAAPDVASVLAAVDDLPDSWVRDMVALWAGDQPIDDPYVAPGHADLAGLPPAYVVSCGHDSLRRASEPFADRLADAGVPAWHDLLETSTHAPLDRPGTTDGHVAIDRLRTWLTGGITSMDTTPGG